MSDNLFGDLNRDGTEDWKDDMLGIWVLETLNRQEQEATSDTSSSNSGSGAMVLIIMALFLAAWLCSALAR